MTSRLAVLVLAIVIPRIGHTDDARPWANDVSEAQQAEAKRLLDAGNQLFLQREFLEAIEKYRAATAQWDHPAIQFNIVRALIQLERFVEASELLARALKYGEAPFEEGIYREALAYQKLLANEVGTIETHCEQAGVEVTLDGQPLMTCPGTSRRDVSPGRHQLVGTKRGFLTLTLPIVVFGGKHERATLTLDPLEKGARIVHRWPTWIPWTVIGGGFGLAAVGGLIQWKASADNDTYLELVKDRCADSCPATFDRSLRENAVLENRIAIGVAGVGAAAVLAGGVMLYLNRGTTVYEVTPAPGGAALTIRGGF